MNRASVALPKVYHQLAVRRGTGCSSTGVSASLTPARSSIHRPIDRSLATSRLALHRPGQGRELAAAHPELLLADPVLVLEQAARRRAGGAGAILVVRPAVTRAHEQARLGEPPHRAAEVRAVDREDLELLALDAAHPARDLRRRPVPLD